MSGKLPVVESPLLLQLPKSVLTFSDKSGKSILMPVAVDNVTVTESSVQSSTNTPIVTEATSVCQLQQPLLCRGSPSPKMSVPYSESNAPTTNVEPIQAGVSHSRSHLQPFTCDAEMSNQSAETQNFSFSSAVGPPPQSNTVFPGFQNQSPTVPSAPIGQPGCFQPTIVKQENIHTGHQNVYQESVVPPVNDYSNDNRPIMTAYPVPSEYSDSFNVSPDDFSQPPVISPSNTQVLQNFGKDSSQVPQGSFPNTSNQNFMSQNLNFMAPELYSRIYEPVQPYWLFLDIVETKELWYGFSEIDSNNLEVAFQQDDHAVVPVDGGRYDALLDERIKTPVYFEAKNLQISRGTWFYRRGSSQRYIPFPEIASDLLEQHYANCVTSGQWQKRVNVPGIGSVVLESPQVLSYYKSEVEIWPSLPDSKTSPQPVRRGLPENFDLIPNQTGCIDHLVFIVQGIGSFCDLRFRTVAECVDGVRDIADKLMDVHFRNELVLGQVGRVEFLPVAWHAKLHTSDKGFDRCMQNITLPSIPKLRHFTNDTLLDILLYSSPTYCQSIIDTVAFELNRLYAIFLKRNPEFSGSVFVAGHSLGSLILFDILANQSANDESNESPPINELLTDVQESNLDSDNSKISCESNIQETYGSIESLLQACQLEEYLELFNKEKIDLSSVSLLSDNDLKDLELPTGPRKKLLMAIQHNNQKSSDGAVDVPSLPSTSFPSTSQASQSRAISVLHMQDASQDVDNLGFPLKTSPCMSSIKYPKLCFQPASFFALGSPISMFLTVRGYEYISEDFKFPTCPGFFHIFHPYDPVAFRIEPLIEPTFSAQPVLIPHHKGRKRMHLEIRENLSKVGSEIKQKVLETLRYTWDSLSVFAKARTFSAAVEAEVDRLMEQEIINSEYETKAPSETPEEDIQIGSLNGGRRIDYVLQEKPIEALNDYIFALTSHATYWDSEDTVLMILREIYATQGILVSSQSLEVTCPPSEKSCDIHVKFNSAMSDPSLYKSSQVGVDSLKMSSYIRPDTNPISSRGIQHAVIDSANAYCEVASSAPEFQASSNVPPAATSAQTFTPPPTSTFQPVRPPSASTPHPVRPPSASTSQLVIPPPASTSQPIGPPPLKGFVKRSAFTR